MSGYYSAGILSFIRTLFELYIAILLVRLLLDWFSGKLFNPVYRFIYNITQPPIGIVQKFLPTKHGFNWACFAVAMLLEIIEILVLFYFTTAQMPGVLGLLIWAIAGILSLAKIIFFWSIIIYAILSWISAMNHNHNPLEEITGILVRPLLRPIQKILPTIGGFDLSPIVVFLGLQVINFFIIVPLISLGQGLAL